MKRNILIFSICLFFLPTLFAQNENADQTGSPYFHIQTEGVDVEEFPLMSTTADVNITGPIADATVTQTYKNDCGVPIEAIYVFPASTRAAVYEMSMRIGDRVIKAEVHEKNKARRVYEQAKSEGKRTSLLEQSRPNVFQMNVGNILPGDTIIVELKYNEFLIPEDKVYSFIYPTVVGPRFADSRHMDADDNFVNSPYTKENIEPSYDFDIKVNLHAGMKISKAFSISHTINVAYADPSTASIRLDATEKKGGNKDFIFQYSLANDKISKGTFLYEHGDENFFLTMIEPPKRIESNDIPPREYVFVMDISGSMRGFPINVSKNLMKDLVSKLRPVDKFNVILFAGSSKIFSEQSVVANQANLSQAFQFIDAPGGGGGTRLLPALKRALALPNDREINSRSIVVVTDGYVHVEREAFELIANNLNKSNLFAFGIGKGVNRHLIEGMAHAGQGAAFVITEKKYAAAEAERFRKYIEKPLLTNIEVSYEGLEVYDVTPLSIPDLLAERPLYIFGKYRGKPKGKIRIKGFQGSQAYEETVKVKPKMKSKDHSPIRYLWAREKIRWLDDLNSLAQSQETVQEVTDLGLKYNLLTKYTSFVAVDDNPTYADSGNTKKVKQPLPMPQGVSNHAIGFEMKIDGVVKSDEVSKKGKLFVHISGNADTAFKKDLHKTLQQSISFSSHEKSFLNGNTLVIEYDQVEDRWIIKDTGKRLTKAFIAQFTELLKNEFVQPRKSFTIKINMLWL